MTRSADDAALAKAREPTPARDRGDGVERFDPEAVPGSFAPRRGSYLKPCPACKAMIATAHKKCPECLAPCTKKRRSKK